jgi:hypothetical protein
MTILLCSLSSQPCAPAVAGPVCPRVEDPYSVSELQRSDPGLHEAQGEVPQARHLQVVPWVVSPKAKAQGKAQFLEGTERWKIEIFLRLAQHSPERAHAPSGVLP